MLKINIEIKNKMEQYFNFKPIICIKDGMVFTIPFTIVGSIFLVMLQLTMLPPVFLDLFTRIVNYSFNSIGLVACMGMAYSYNKKEKNFLSVVTTLLVYFILCTPTQSDGKQLISLEWMGNKGIITAIIVGILFSYIYENTSITEKKLNIFKELPDNIKTVFESIVPSFICLSTAGIMATFLNFFMNKSLGEVIYSTLQIPLQNISDTFIGAITITLVISLFWFFGIHGNALISGIVAPILLSNSLNNQNLLENHAALTVSNGAHIVTYQFLNQFITLSGSGISIGLILVMILFAKKTSSRQLGRLALVPSIFNINEPVMFGVPIVMNPYLLVPFVTIPMVSTIVLYFLIYFGVIPPFNGIILPWITPPLLSGFLLGSYKYVLFQIGQIVFSTLFYIPFFKRYEKLVNK
jgi:PTS system cellobiose-specific IIC component